MTNAEKTQILKDNISCIVKNSKSVDETYLFNFAKQQAKEMKIEISKGEIKSIIYEILMLSEQNNINFLDENSYYIENQSCPNIFKELENENPFLFP